MKKEFKIATNLSSEDIKIRIQRLLDKNWGIPFLFRKNLYKGSNDENSFKIITKFDDPPIVAKGIINKEAIEIKVEWDSNKIAYNSLFYGLTLPAIFMVIFFIIYKNPESFFSYFVSIILLTIYYITQKIIVLINYTEPNPKSIIKDLKKALQ